MKKGRGEKKTLRKFRWVVKFKKVKVRNAPQSANESKKGKRKFLKK